jgi:lipopolysaccharide biosynthesis regulator YciM
MSNPTTFINLYSQNIVQFCQLMATLRTQNDQITQDPTLITRYFAQNPNQIRSDIVAADVSNAQEALVQMLFTFDSGSPTQKSYLYKMQP